jgi:glucoamylase
MCTPITRAIFPPIHQLQTPVWLYSAVLGNGHVLACLDETGSVTQFFFPYVDCGPHVRSLLTGLQVSGISTQLRV